MDETNASGWTIPFEPLSQIIHTNRESFRLIYTQQYIVKTYRLNKANCADHTLHPPFNLCT